MRRQVFSVVKGLQYLHSMSFTCLVAIIQTFNIFFLPKKISQESSNLVDMSTITQCVVDLSNPNPENVQLRTVQLTLTVKPGATTEGIKEGVVKSLRENYPGNVKVQYEPIGNRERIYYITITSTEMTQGGLERWTLNFAMFALRDHPNVSNVSVTHDEYTSMGQIRYTVTR